RSASTASMCRRSSSGASSPSRCISSCAGSSPRSASIVSSGIARSSISRSSPSCSPASSALPLSFWSHSPMKRLGRVLLTLVVVAVSILAGGFVWNYYMDEPWTRDGRVRADVVGLAPDVSGLVAEVLVHDNQQVKRGDVIFRVDLERFQLALQQA